MLRVQTMPGLSSPGVPFRERIRRIWEEENSWDCAVMGVGRPWEVKRATAVAVNHAVGPTTTASGEDATLIFTHTSSDDSVVDQDWEDAVLGRGVVLPDELLWSGDDEAAETGVEANFDAGAHLTTESEAAPPRTTPDQARDISPTPAATTARRTSTAPASTPRTTPAPDSEATPAPGDSDAEDTPVPGLKERRSDAPSPSVRAVSLPAAPTTPRPTTPTTPPSTPTKPTTPTLRATPPHDRYLSPEYSPSLAWDLGQWTRPPQPPRVSQSLSPEYSPSMEWDGELRTYVRLRSRVGTPGATLSPIPASPTPAPQYSPSTIWANALATLPKPRPVSPSPAGCRDAIVSTAAQDSSSPTASSSSSSSLNQDSGLASLSLRAPPSAAPLTSTADGSRPSIPTPTAPSGSLPPPSVLSTPRLPNAIPSASIAPPPPASTPPPIPPPPTYAPPGSTRPPTSTPPAIPPPPTSPPPFIPPPPTSPPPFIPPPPTSTPPAIPPPPTSAPPFIPPPPPQPRARLSLQIKLKDNAKRPRPLALAPAAVSLDLSSPPVQVGRNTSRAPGKAPLPRQ